VARLIVLQGVVAVGAEGAGKYSNVPKHTLQRLVQDVGQLVLKVLRGHEGVEKVSPPFSFHGLNLSTGAGYVGVGVERLPQVVQRCTSGPGADIEEDTHVRVKRFAKRVEEPAVRVELLLVLLLETEDHLAGHDALLGTLELEI
jgi:hypothetical protein